MGLIYEVDHPAQVLILLAHAFGKVSAFAKEPFHGTSFQYHHLVVQTFIAANLSM